MKIFKSLLFASLLFSVLSCKEKDSSSDNRSEEVKELSGVSRLKVNGVFNLYLTQSDEESIQVSGSPELVEKLKIEQNGDLLELTLEGVKGSFFQKVNLEVNLALSDLKEFEFNGVGNIQTKNNFNLEKTSIKGEGVGNLQLEMSALQIIAELNLLGNMEFKGKATSLVIVNEGIGNVDASALTAEKVNLFSSGIGRVAVHCTGELAMEVTGIGEIAYTGNPTVTKEKISGIGKVRRNEN